MSSCRLAGVRLYVVANVGFEVGALSISYEMVAHDVQCNEMVSRGQPRLGGSQIIIDFTRVACVWSYMTTHTAKWPSVAIRGYGLLFDSLLLLRRAEAWTGMAGLRGLSESAHRMLCSCASGLALLVYGSSSDVVTLCV